MRSLILLLLSTLAINAQTSVTPRGEAQNVRFEQREDGVVHIFYDLISSDPRAVFAVRLEASQDGGATFVVRPQSTTGDMGDGVRPGAGKRIVWDSGRDVERLQLDRFRVRIIATAAPTAVEAPPPSAATAEPASKAPAQPTTSAAPPPAQKGGGTKWLLIGGGVAAAAGVAIAAGGGGGGDAGTTTPPAAAASACSFSVSANPLAVPPTGGSLEFTVTVSPSNCSNPGWTSNGPTSICSGAATSGSGTTTVRMSCEGNNYSSSRTHAFTIAGQAVTLTQAPHCTWSIRFTDSVGNPLRAVVAAAGGRRSILITASSSTCVADFNSEVEYLRFGTNTGVGYVGSGTFDGPTLAPNTGPARETRLVQDGTSNILTIRQCGVGQPVNAQGECP